MQTILITGGTGMVGTALRELLLERGYEVILLSRQEHSRKLPSGDHLRIAHWDIKKQEIAEEAVAAADFIIHLAGEGIAEKRWTIARKKEILESRTQGSALIYRALLRQPNRIKAIISASAIGYYGGDDDKIFRETDTPADSFLGDTCAQWEKSVLQMQEIAKRVVILRLGIVLSKDGGLLKKWMLPLRYGFAGIPGNGEQWISWIHLRDVCRLFYTAVANERMQGVYNAVAPFPVTIKELVISMAKAMKGKNYLPVYLPSSLLELWRGEMSSELLKSCRASLEKLSATGFQFSFPTIQSSMEEIFKRR